MTVADLIQEDEGLRLRPYVDTVGKVTIGYGRNLTDTGITTAEATVLFVDDLDAATATARAVCPSYEALGEVRQAVLVDAAFALGEARLRQFVAFLEAVSKQDWAGASYGLVASRWHDEATARVDRLARMMSTGQWPGEVIS